MPGFIWAAELSARRLFADGKANGLLVIDATGSGSIELLVFLYYPGDFPRGYSSRKAELLDESSAVVPALFPDIGPNNTQTFRRLFSEHCVTGVLNHF